MTPRENQAAARVVAGLEAAKGLLAFAAAVGAFEMTQGRARVVAEGLARRLHLNPAKGSPRVVLEAVADLTDGRLLILAAAALAYSAIRFAEAYGLWHGRNWARVFGIVTGGIYIPFEVVEVVRERSFLALLALAVNLAVVFVLWKTHMKSSTAISRSTASAPPLSSP